MIDVDPKENSAPPLRLPDFIRAHMDPIIVEWINFACTRTPASEGMTQLALRNHIEEILNFVADDLESVQTNQEQLDKSHGLSPDDDPSAPSVGAEHAALRFIEGFDIDQMVSEYRALRASVVKQWIAHNKVLAASDLEDLTRFHEAIDQAMTESVAHYTHAINESRNLFLAVLGHDLRNPIGAATMAALRLVEGNSSDPKHSFLATQIVSATERATKILNDLLELTRSGFGAEIPIEKSTMDMGELGSQLVEEMRTLSNGRAIELSASGDMTGAWDRTRIGQVLSNLIGNAVQYSTMDSVVRVTIDGQGDEMVHSVHNEGDPIPSGKASAVFNSFTRGGHGDARLKNVVNLGLGLYVSKKFVLAHHGEINVVSTADEGTTFTVRLPRR